MGLGPAWVIYKLVGEAAHRAPFLTGSWPETRTIGKEHVSVIFSQLPGYVGYSLHLKLNSSTRCCPGRYTMRRKMPLEALHVVGGREPFVVLSYYWRKCNSIEVLHGRSRWKHFCLVLNILVSRCWIKHCTGIMICWLWKETDITRRCTELKSWRSDTS